MIGPVIAIDTRELSVNQTGPHVIESTSPVVAPPLTSDLWLD